MIRPELFWKLVRFGFVGLVVMIFFVTLNWLLSPLVGAQPAFLLAYPPALGLHFVLNKWWTFGSRRTDGPRQISEYIVMAAITFAIQWAVFKSLMTWTSFPSWINSGLANITQMTITFLVMNRRIFASPNSGS